jgi:hypothetical protein
LAHTVIVSSLLYQPQYTSIANQFSCSLRTTDICRLLPLFRRRKRAAVVSRRTHPGTVVDIFPPLIRTAVVAVGPLAADFELRPPGSVHSCVDIEAGGWRGERCSHGTDVGRGCVEGDARVVALYIFQAENKDNQGQ